MRARRARIFTTRQGRDYLDFLSGYSVFNIGRNHPAVQQAIRDVLELDLPNMVQMDCSLLSGLLAEALLKKLPSHLDAVFFCNSGAEAVEGAIKFARAATGRSGLLSLDRPFTASRTARSRSWATRTFAKASVRCSRIACAWLSAISRALEEQLARRDIAALVIEPVQGKGVNFPRDDFYREAQRLCRAHGTLLICDEVQTGLGRTGRWWGFEHWDLEPDIITVAKSLSGGYVPVRGRRHSALHLSKDLQIASTAAWCIPRPLGATTSPWPRAGHARR